LGNTIAVIHWTYTEQTTLGGVIANVVVEGKFSESVTRLLLGLHLQRFSLDTPVNFLMEIALIPLITGGAK